MREVTVIEEAIRYIDYLHSALLTRLRTKGLPSCLRGVDVDVNHLNLDDIKELVRTPILPSPTTRDPACCLLILPLDIRSRRGRSFKQKTLNHKEYKQKTQVTEPNCTDFFLCIAEDSLTAFIQYCL
ncbi:BHLH domain-containing protein [Trichonephila inaurata madagascariensis]|uniref:BHLH domain-containing protein n=1 Tax=Trichonephila inaurata madagascariensis TaxID=2747483 RepID=A0A8X6X1Y5_9ARAC|nr:BHLH domain-containing protein [Trichonephila inaurata madagascariensis]